jgi:acyl carrier protein
MCAVESVEALSIEIKRLIIDALALEEIAIADIATDAPLFGAGLELDSIDALELAIALEDRYGVTIGEDLDKNESLFASVESLATFVAETRTR